MASPPSPPNPRIIKLATQIQTSVTQLQEALSAQNLPTPSFDERAPKTLPPNVTHLKDTILDATAELHELLLDPLSLLFKFANVSNLVPIDFLTRYQIPSMVPLNGSISFASISEKTGLSHGTVRRMLRHAMAMRIFREPEPEIVAHTSISKFLTLPYINGWVQMESRETWPACTRIVDALRKWPNSQEANETAYTLANNGLSPQEVLKSDPSRATHFLSAMQAINHVPGYAPSLITYIYDWGSLPKETHIVHINGSNGQIAIELAMNFPNIKILVQDSGAVIQGADSGVPEKVKGRVEFMDHGLFEKQTVKADVYFFRMVFRNLGDKYAVQVFKAQVPVMRHGVKILIQDVCMPEPDAIPLWRERVSRSVDLALVCFSNGRERYLDEWKALLAEADTRFVLHRIYVPKDNLLGILEVHWDESGAGPA